MEHQPQGLLPDSHEMKVMKDVFLSVRRPRSYTVAFAMSRRVLENDWMLPGSAVL